MNDLEIHILSDAIASFEQETSIKLNTFPAGNQVDVELRTKDNKITFSAEIKQQVTNANIGSIRNQLTKFKNIPLLITRYVNVELSKLLKKLGINFIDTAGNCYINVPPLFLYMKGNRLEDFRQIKIKKDNDNKYKTASLQLFFALLSNPGLENNPYREIADHAKIALGSVQLYMSYLEKKGFLLRENNTKILTDKKQLFQLFVENYNEQIKNKNIIGRYEIAVNPIEIGNSLNNYGALLGGETAAAEITNYLRPLMHTIYIEEKVGEFILRNKLKKRPNGNIVLIKKFWHFNDENTVHNIVPDILIYADLLNTNDPRNIETANIIYETRITKYL